MTWPDGFRYDGQWLGGVQHGTGTICESGGVERQVKFDQGTQLA